jgi:20S proteasome alpha/beta subunit
MTTLVALASKHALVMGADSLGTETRRLVDPRRLYKFFDADNDFKLRTGSDGKPLLRDIFGLVAEAEHVPYNQLLHVNKLFRLGTLPIGVAFTGTTSVGSNTIRGLITDFTEADPGVKAAGTRNYAVHTIAQRLLDFLRKHYEAEVTDEFLPPELELLIGGYDRNRQWPVIYRADVRRNTLERVFDAGEFGVAFAGQMDWIQRIVFGTDTRNKVNLRRRTEKVLDLYRQKIVERLESDGHNVEVPTADTLGEELQLFHEWDLDGLEASWDEFSEQNAIDCVDFFLYIMIRAQDVSQQLPTVGGSVHIAVIRKDGFHPVTKEVWKHGDHEVQIPGVGT